jgi:hypothetical protein
MPHAKRAFAQRVMVSLVGSVARQSQILFGFAPSRALPGAKLTATECILSRRLVSRRPGSVTAPTSFAAAERGSAPFPASR